MTGARIAQGLRQELALENTVRDIELQAPGSGHSFYRVIVELELPTHFISSKQYGVAAAQLRAPGHSLCDGEYMFVSTRSGHQYDFERNGNMQSAYVTLVVHPEDCFGSKDQGRESLVRDAAEAIRGVYKAFKKVLGIEDAEQQALIIDLLNHDGLVKSLYGRRISHLPLLPLPQYQPKTSSIKSTGSGAGNANVPGYPTAASPQGNGQAGQAGSGNQPTGSANGSAGSASSGSGSATGAGSSNAGGNGTLPPDFRKAFRNLQKHFDAYGNPKSPFPKIGPDIIDND